MWNLLGPGIEPIPPINHWTSREILDIKYLTVIMAAWASLVAQLVKNLPAMWETWVRSLGWEDPLEKETVTHPVFWPGEFLGVAKSQIQLGNFHFHYGCLMSWRHCLLRWKPKLFAIWPLTGPEKICLLLLWKDILGDWKGKLKEHIPDVFHHVNNTGGPYPAPLITQVRKVGSGGSFWTLAAHKNPPGRFNTCRVFGPDLKIF